MVVVGLVQEVLGLLNGLLGHFVNTPAAITPTLSQDYEWFIGTATPATMTTKGNYLLGAVADIATYGAILVDWIVQALLTTPTNVNTPPST
jgi:hypothetical protein